MKVNDPSELSRSSGVSMKEAVTILCSGTTSPESRSVSSGIATNSLSGLGKKSGSLRVSRSGAGGVQTVKRCAVFKRTGLVAGEEARIDADLVGLVTGLEVCP